MAAQVHKYTLSDFEYAQLSDVAYNNSLHDKKFQKDNLVIIKNDRNGNEYFRVHLVSDPNNVGYQGYLMEKLTANKQPTGEFITVNRGSESPKGATKEEGVRDWAGNFELMEKGVHPQEKFAIEFSKNANIKANEIAQKNGMHSYSMANTGHSLGGFEAHMGHLVNHGKVVAFNALNPAFSNEWKRNLNKVNNNLIENHIMALDIASSAHKDKMPGTIHTYATENDNRILNANGYGNFMPNRPILLVSDDVAFNHLSHSNSYFAGEHSVLRDPQAKVRANELKEKINEWRSEVPENREAIINNINSAIQKYQNINDTYKKYKTILDRLDLGEVNLNQDFNAVQVASADKNFIPSLEPTLSPTSQRVIQQCDEKFTALCERRGVTADHPDEMDNVKMAAAYVALHAGLTKIDKMDFGENRTLFMLSHEPHMKLASLSTDEAVNIPVSQSMANIHIMEQQNAQQSQERQMTQSQQQNQGRTIG